MISHANTDHYNALPAVVRRGWLGEVCLNAYFGRGSDAERAGVKTLMTLLAEEGVRVRRLQAGQQLRLDGRTDVEVLWPPAGRGGLSVNDTSLVLRITCDGRSVLLTGDLSEVGQAELAARGPQVRADVLVMPHHGGWEGQLPAFVAAVAPQAVIVSSDREPEAPLSGGPAAEAFYRTLTHRYRYYSTPANGWIRVRFGTGGVEVETMRP